MNQHALFARRFGIDLDNGVNDVPELRQRRTARWLGSNLEAKIAVSDSVHTSCTREPCVHAALAERAWSKPVRVAEFLLLDALQRCEQLQSRPSHFRSRSCLSTQDGSCVPAWMLAICLCSVSNFAVAASNTASV